MRILARDGSSLETPAGWLSAFRDAPVNRRRSLAAVVPSAPSGGWRAALRTAVMLATDDGHSQVAATLSARLTATDAPSAWDPAASYTCPACAHTLPAEDFGCRLARTVSVPLADAPRILAEARATVSPAMARKVGPVGAARKRDGTPDPDAVRVLLPTRHSHCADCRNAERQGFDSSVDPAYLDKRNRAEAARAARKGGAE